MLRFLLLVVCFALPAGAALAERRVALVISVDDYTHLRPLSNAVNDGRAVRDALEELDFDVRFVSNKDLATVRDEIARFREDAAGADVALAFFAGHGVEISGDNRLLLKDTDAASLARLRETSLPLEEVRDLVANVGKVALVLLDACRNDPFGTVAGEGRAAIVLTKEVETAARPGFVRAPGRSGKAGAVLFAFSASPGFVASDGVGDNSAFSAALARYLPSDGLEIRSVLTLVKQEVYERSNMAQVPYVEDGLPGVFFAAETGVLPERETLLIAMAELTPAIRAEVERAAADNAVPLAPLYGALIASDLRSLTVTDRGKALAESAAAYLDTQRRLADLVNLSSRDEEVTRLRAAAEESLGLGLFARANSELERAIAIDDRAGDMLGANLVERRLSQAASLRAKAGIARTRLDHAAAIATLEKAATLYAEIEGLEQADGARRDRTWLLAEIGDLHVLVGDTAPALEAYGRMEAAAQARLAASTGKPEAESDYAESLDKIGSVHRAQGNHDQALTFYLRSHEIMVSLAARHPDNTAWQRDLSVTVSRIGGIYWSDLDYKNALSYFERALEILLIIPENKNDIGKSIKSNIASGYIAVGQAKYRLRNVSGANSDYSNGLDILYSILNEFPDDQEVRLDMVNALFSIGQSQKSLGRLEDAGKYFYQAFLITSKLVEVDRDNSDWGMNHSYSYENFGDLSIAKDSYIFAINFYQECALLRDQLVEKDPLNVEWLSASATAHYKIAQVWEFRGNWERALGKYQHALETRKQIRNLAPNNPTALNDLMDAHDKVGGALQSLGELNSALASYHEGKMIAQRLKTLVSDKMRLERRIDYFRDVIADILVSQGNISNALLVYEEKLQAVAEQLLRDPNNTEIQREFSSIHLRMGDLHKGQGNASDALSSYDASLTIRRRLAELPDGPRTLRLRDLSNNLIKIAILHSDQGDRKGALQAYSENLLVAEQLAAASNTNKVRLIESHYLLAKFGENSRRHFEKALQIAIEMERDGTLPSSDAHIPNALRAELGKLDIAE